MRKPGSENDEAWRALGLHLNLLSHTGLERRGTEEMPVAQPLIFPWQPYKHIAR